jgi:hypothetical protein
VKHMTMKVSSWLSWLFRMGQMRTRALCASVEQARGASRYSWSTPPNLLHQETESRRSSLLCSLSYGTVRYDTCGASFRKRRTRVSSFGGEMKVSIGECGSHQLCWRKPRKTLRFGMSSVYSGGEKQYFSNMKGLAWKVRRECSRKQTNFGRYFRCHIPGDN